MDIVDELSCMRLACTTHKDPLKDLRTFSSVLCVATRSKPSVRLYIVDYVEAIIIRSKAIIFLQNLA